jgi:hypothetical protein
MEEQPLTKYEEVMELIDIYDKMKTYNQPIYAIHITATFSMVVSIINYN